MKKIITILVFTLFLVLSLTAGVSQQAIQEAQACFSESAAKKLLNSYDKSNPHTNLYMGIVYLNLSNKNPGKYLAKAEEHAKKAMDSTKSPLARAYYGSTKTRQAGSFSKKGDMEKAMQYLEEGIALIDQAVSKNPTDINIRLFRLEHSWFISKASPYKRFDKMKKDLEFLVAKCSTLPAAQQSMVHYYSGQIALNENNTDNALSGFEKAIKCAPQSRYAKGARTAIDKLEN
ncbi:MAG: hypothetical protein GY757_61910 [bacterium]|nr:hypothetical protein [bacterium]